MHVEILVHVILDKMSGIVFLLKILLKVY